MIRKRQTHFLRPRSLFPKDRKVITFHLCLISSNLSLIHNQSLPSEQIYHPNYLPETSKPSTKIIIININMQPSALFLLASTYAVSASAIAIRTTSGFCAGSSSTGNGTVIDGTSCTAECSLDRPGGDFASLQVADLSACAAACEAQSSCLDATFVEASSFCYLKNFILNPVSAGNVDTVVCRTCANGAPIPNTSCTQECGVDRPGNDIEAIGPIDGAGALQTCAQACDANPKCVTAQFSYGNRVSTFNPVDSNEYAC